LSGGEGDGVQPVVLQPEVAEGREGHDPEGEERHPGGGHVDVEDPLYHPHRGLGGGVEEDQVERPDQRGRGEDAQGARPDSRSSIAAGVDHGTRLRLVSLRYTDRPTFVLRLPYYSSTTFPNSVVQTKRKRRSNAASIRTLPAISSNGLPRSSRCTAV